MRETEVPVTFQSLEKTVYVLRGTKLLEAAAVADLVLASPCGGEGDSAASAAWSSPTAGGPPTPAERKVLLRRGTRRPAAGWRVSARSRAP